MNANGAAHWIKGNKAAVIGVPVTAVVTLVVATYINISNQTATAISVARDHGGELKLLREDYTLLRGALERLEETIRIGTDDRFRAVDAHQMEDRIMERLRRLEAIHDRE